MSRTAAAALAGLALLLLALPALADEASQAQRAKVKEGWTYFDAGNLRKAEEVFQGLYESEWGKHSAEVHYALAGVWWERRNAMAAYRWLEEAVKAKAASPDRWDGGDGADNGIQARMTFVLRNFSVVKLRLPSRKPLAPLADPPPADPLLRSFTDALAAMVAAGAEEKVGSQWVYLPKGTYWVGEKLVLLEAGRLDINQAPAWDLPVGSGSTLAGHLRRTEMIEAGRSPAAEYAKTGIVPGSDARGGTSVAAGGGDLPGGGMVVAVAGGGSTVSRTALDGSGVEVGGSVVVEGGYAIGLPLPGAALRLTLQYANLPVSGCSAAQTRGHSAAFQVGPRFTLPIASSVGLAIHAGLHLGGGSTNLTTDGRAVCADGRLTGGDEGIYGIRLGEEGASGLVSYSELGWGGDFFMIGPEADVGVILHPASSRSAISVGLLLRYDQVFASLPEGMKYYRAGASTTPGSTELGGISGTASMPRFQFGVRVGFLVN